MRKYDLQEYLKDAVEAYQKGDLKLSEKRLLKLLTTFPENDQILSLLGYVLITENPVDATQYLKKALQSNPENGEAWVSLSSAHAAQGHLENALNAMQKAEELEPGHMDVAYNLANIYLPPEQLETAEAAIQKAIRAKPTLASAHTNLGYLFLLKKNLIKAKAAFQQALEIAPDSHPALINMGNLLANEGYLNDAATYYERAISVAPDKQDAYLSLGRLHLEKRRPIRAMQVLSTAIEKDPLNATAFLLLGNAENDLDNKKEAEGNYKKALQLDAENKSANRNLRRLLHEQIPGWHFIMLADESRNEAYQKAIEKAVTNDSIVLDIGTGTGLLSMMAARAGAKKVVACEMNKKLAETAKEIIAANHFSDKITLLNQKSTAIEQEIVLPEKATVLVSEILDAGVIGEGVLPSVRHATKNLITADAVIIPAKAKIFGQLIEIPIRSKVNPIRDISGFDLSAFDMYRIPEEYQTVHMESETHRPLSEVFPITEFDFYNLPNAVDDYEPIIKLLTINIHQGGEAQAVVFWFDLTLHDDIIVSSRPGGELKHWGQALYCFENTKKVNVGDKVEVDFIRNDQLIQFELK